MDIVQANPDKDWDYDTLSYNKNITWKIIKSNPDKPWCYKELSKHPNITWKIVQENPDKPWDYRELSSNRNITWEIVQANPDKPWSYYGLSTANPNITWDIVQENSDKPWNYKHMSSNPIITWEIIQSNPDKPWDYDRFSDNPNMTYEIMINNNNESQNIVFNYKSQDEYLAQYLCNTEDIDITNPYELSQFKYLSSNPNITFKFIKEKLDKPWNYMQLALNEFTLEKDLFFRKKLREWFKKSDLKRELIANLWHPKNYEKFKYYDPEMFLENEDN
jgi:hypothetical protein